MNNLSDTINNPESLSNALAQIRSLRAGKLPQLRLDFEEPEPTKNRKKQPPLKLHKDTTDAFMEALNVSLFLLNLFDDWEIRKAIRARGGKPPTRPKRITRSCHSASTK